MLVESPNGLTCDRLRVYTKKIGDVDETLVRSDRLSNSTATVREPTSRDLQNPSFFIWSARSSTAGLLGRSQVVVARGGAWS